MKYEIEVNNWYEDFYHEEQILCSFDSLSNAISFINSDEFKSKTKVFDVTGEIRWYFPSCDDHGVLINPDIENDVLDCYQTIYIRTDNNDEEIENHIDSRYPIFRYYDLDYLGNVEWL